MKYHSKDTALANKTGDDLVLYTKNFNSFYWAPDYQTVINEIKSSSCSNISEFIFEKKPVNFYLDLDINESTYPSEFKHHVKIAREVTTKLVSFFCDLSLKSRVIALKSHGLSKGISKKSYHLIFRLSKPHEEDEDTDVPVYTTTSTCISIVNYLFPELTSKKIVDASVFREGNFRSIYGSKPGEERPLIPSKIGETDFDDIDSFVQYTPGLESTALIFYESNFEIPINHTKGKSTGALTRPAKKLYISNEKISDDSDIEAILNELDPKYYSERNFWLQTGYILKCISTLPVWLSFSSKWSSYNEKDAVASWNSFKDTGHSLADLRKLIGKDVLSDMQIKNGEKECIDLVLQAWKDPVERFDFDTSLREYTGNAGKEMRKYFSGCPSGCKIFHVINEKGFLMECQSCKNRFPMMPMVIPLTESFGNIYYNIKNNCNNTTTINNYNGIEPDFSCDVQIDPTIFNEQKFTDIINQILDGHKICDVARLLKTRYDLFVYDKKMKDWYFFNGFRWVPDGSLDFKEKLIDARSIFNDILLFYKDHPVTENLTHLRKNVKSLIKKMSDPGFKGLALEEAKLCFRQPDFSKNLNCKKYLVPFTNGVYDLLTGQFRTEGKKEDYVELTVGYDYDSHVNNPAVHDFLQSILPDKSVRDYMLKKLADCLNGDRPNTLFLFLIGVGSNGKTQLMNLMYETMGQFGNKTASSLFTRRRPDSDAPSPSLMSLKDKRFACASETADGEKINLALLKEITGSESSIQARRLNENTTEFKMQAKFFLSTNTLPEIHGEGEAVWRRIRVVVFPTKFIESPDPLKLNEKKADPDIQTRIESDLTWKQTFFNILLGYYNADIPTPEAVLLRTQEYREESNEVEQWVKDNIEFREGGILELTDLNIRRFGPDYHNLRVKGKFKKEVEKVLRQLGESVEGFDHVCKTRTIGGTTSQKWLGLRLTV